MKIAVDAMGGDYAPLEIVFGAVRAAKKYGCEIVLVGDETKIRSVLDKEPGWEKLGITIHPASEVIEMGEHPADAVRTKKDASVVVATRLVKDGVCDAVLSAGSTGAAISSTAASVSALAVSAASAALAASAASAALAASASVGASFSGRLYCSAFFFGLERCNVGSSSFSCCSDARPKWSRKSGVVP